MYSIWAATKCVCTENTCAYKENIGGARPLISPQYLLTIYKERKHILDEHIIYMFIYKKCI